MTGNNFFTAAIDAVGLILRNPARFLIVGGLGELFVSIGKLAICLITAIMCYLIITKSATF